MCECELCHVCHKPIAIKEGCPDHRIKDIKPSHNLARDEICIDCETLIVNRWLGRHGLSILSE